jgi:Putative auto-transporter adhesin, head GIN domain
MNCLYYITVKTNIMKVFKILIPAIIVLLSLQACNKGRIWGMRGKGDNISETRNAGAFIGVDLRCDADVELIRDSTFTIEITGQENILKVLDTKVENGNLIIDYKKRVWRHNKVKIIIHIGNLQSAFISGSGNINIQSEINANTFDLKISGSGDINTTTLNAQTLTAHISGSGDIKIPAGAIHSAKFSISGSGDIDSEYAVSAVTDAKISGSGNITVNVTETLNASISGSGDIKYRGNPTVTVNISGSGRVTRI